MASVEFEQSAQISGLNGTGLDLDRPRAPGSLKHAVDFIGFFPPVRDSLSANPRVREAGVFDPDTKSGGIVGRARNALVSRPASAAAKINCYAEFAL